STVLAEAGDGLGEVHAQNKAPKDGCALAVFSTPSFRGQDTPTLRSSPRLPCPSLVDAVPSNYPGPPSTHDGTHSFSGRRTPVGRQHYFFDIVVQRAAEFARTGACELAAGGDPDTEDLAVEHIERRIGAARVSAHLRVQSRER